MKLHLNFCVRGFKILGVKLILKINNLCIYSVYQILHCIKYLLQKKGKPLVLRHLGNLNQVLCILILNNWFFAN